MDEHTRQPAEVAASADTLPDALISEVKKPWIIWLILVWIFVCLGLVFQQLVAGYAELAQLQAQTAKQLNAGVAILIICLMIGVGKLNKIICLVTGGVFALLTAVLILNISLNARDFGFLQMMAAFLCVIVPTAMCAHWLLKPESRVLYRQYAAHKHNLAMKKAVAARFRP